MRLDAVGKRYGLRQPWVVRDVTQDVAAGRLIRVEGPNGSGKSTLLRMAAGVTVPSAGRVTGRPPTGYVPERFPGGLAFSAREYLAHMSRIHGLSGAAVPAAAEEWLARLGASEYASAPLRTLSKGMCQKVVIAQALLAQPGLLVLDEAWTGLDQAARGALDAAVAQRVAAGGAVLFVDHDPARLAGRVDERWQLAGGRVAVAPGRAPASERMSAVVADGGSTGIEGAAATRRPDAEGPGAATAIIDVTGLEPGSLAELARLPGVITTATGAAAHGVSRVRLTVVAGASDEVLRALLGWDGVHVRTVRAEPDRAADR
jgi:ABC-2 type transport system ATP-binding protein